MTGSGFGLVVQRLPRRRDRVLAVGHYVGTQAGDGWFSPGDVAKMFESLRLPKPGNISQELARLRDDELVMARGGGSWSLTPEGAEAVRDLVGQVDVKAVEAEMTVQGSARLAGVEHPLIPPEAAPVRFSAAVRRLLVGSTFERNVFCMTRFPSHEDAPDDPLAETIETLRRALARQGLVMHLASDRNADDELFGNVAAHIWGCKFGVALLETRGQAELPVDARQLNDNVLIEVGAMLVTGRRCCLLKDAIAPKPPSDFVAHIYKTIDFEDQAAVETAADRWVADDLGLRP